MLSARNISWGKIEFNNYRYITKEAFEDEHKRVDIQPGDVLLTIVGTIGRAAVVPEGHEQFALQRQFARQAVLFDTELNNTVYQLPRLFPTAAHENYGVVLTDAGSHFEFCAIATDLLPNLHLLDTGKFFARYTYEAVDSRAAQGALDFGTSDDVVIEGYRRLDNITDETLTAYRAWYGDDVTKDGIFAFVYGLLHSPDYRSRFAADLKR